MKMDVKNRNTIAKAAEALEFGGVVMHPTETCYGLAVNIFNEGAIKKLYKIKGRNFKKPVSILVDGLGMAQEYGVFSDKATELATKFWPGPLSIVVPRKKTLPDFLNPGEELISFRYSADAFCESLVEAFGKPITTTSANFAGDDPLYSAEEFSDELDLIVDGGVLSFESPSTVVRVDGDRVQILRQGGVLIEDAS